MTDVSTLSESESDSGNDLPNNCIKRAILKKLYSELEESDKLYQQCKENDKIVKGIRNELVQFLKIHRKCLRFRIWKKIPVDSYAADGRCDLVKVILLEWRLVWNKFKTFNGKLENAWELRTCFINRILAHIHEMNGIYVDVSSGIMEKLENVVVPTLDWVSTMQNPEIDKLYKEWKDMELLARIDYLHKQLLQIFYSSQVMHFDVHNAKDDCF